MQTQPQQRHFMYHSGCCPETAHQLARLVLQAYEFYYAASNGRAKAGSFPETLDIEGKRYEIATVFRAKALELSRYKVLGFVAHCEDSAYVLFRGTQSPSEWVGDGRFVQVRFMKDWGKVHSGFKLIYRSCSHQIIDVLHTLQAHTPEIKRVYIAGHSLGAAISTLACADIARHGIFPEVQHYTFASPRVGNPTFHEKFQRAVPASYRFVNTEDVVTTEPKAVNITPLNQFAHIGIPFAFTYQGGTILENHLLESYMRFL